MKMAEQSPKISERGKNGKPASERRGAEARTAANPTANRAKTTPRKPAGKNKAAATSSPKSHERADQKPQALHAASNFASEAIDRARKVAAKLPAIRATAAIAIALAAGLIVWLLVIRGGGDSGKTTPAAAPAAGIELVTASHLLDAVAGSGYPVYWIGPEPGARYEVTHPGAGRVRIRYLPSGETPGTKTQYLSVSSYQQQDAYRTIEKLTAKSEATSFEIAHGGLAYVDRNAPLSVYVAFPSVPTQIEVYYPHPGRAQALVRSGIVAPVG